jgi:hypothetical protein
MNAESTEDFRNWLISSHNLQRRSAGDIISRRNKLLGIIDDPSSMKLEQIKARLEQELIRGIFTKSTLSGMLRSEKLYRVFTKS